MSESAQEIPRRTRGEIANPAPRGERHHQAIKIAVPLVAQGLVDDAVFAQLRSMYDSDVSDRELAKIVEWARAKNPQPCRSNANGAITLKKIAATTPTRVTPQRAQANVEAFLNGWRCEIADLWHASPWRPCEDFHKDASQVLAALCGRDDHINVVTDFIIEKQKDGAEKACPRGAGTTLLRDDWLKRLRDAPAPCNDAGAWMRPNPVKNPHGSGIDGAHTDADVASNRFLLIESDTLPTELQLSLWSRLKLPVAALIDTAGRSVHAWIKVDCSDEEHYRELALKIYESLGRFGVCRANKNPSRLSRLPGVRRKIGGIGACEQRLFYLNPSPCARPIFEGS
jgi:hypothetical protein